MKRFRYALMIVLSMVILTSVQVQAQEDRGFLPPSEVINADNVNQLKEVATLGLGEIYAVAYSPNGEEVAIASATGLSIYSGDDWASPTHIIKNDGERVAVAFTKDGQSLITYPNTYFYWVPAETGDLKLYDISSGKVKVLVADFTKSVDKVVVDPQGRWIASVEQTCRNFSSGSICGNGSFSIRDVRIRIHDMSSGELLQTITPNAFISDLEFQPNSSSLVFLRRYGVEDMDDLVFWDVNDGKQIDAWQFDHNKYAQFAISGDGQTIGLPLEKEGKRYLHVDFLDIQTSTISRSFEASYKALETIGNYYSSDMDSLFSGRIWLNDDASQVFTQEYTDPGIEFYIWDTTTGLMVFTKPNLYVPTRDVAFSPSTDSTVIVQFDDSVLQWESYSQKVNTLIGGQRFMEKAILSPDNELLAIEGDRYGHSLYDFQNGRRLTLPENSRPLAISSNSDMIALKTNDEIRIWNRKQDKVLTSITFDKASVLSAAFSPDDKLLAVGLEPLMIVDLEGNVTASYWELVHIYDVETGKLLAVERAYAGRNDKLLFSSDGSLLVTDAGVWNVKEWLSSGIVDQANQPEWLIGLPLALSRDASLIATVSIAKDDWSPMRIIHVFDTQLHKELFTFDAHHGEVSALAFNPAGTLLASASADRDATVRDNSVRLWSMETGKELITLEVQYNDYMRDVIFSNDGKYIITLRGGCDCEGWGFNSAVRIWGIPTNAEPNP